MPQGRTITLISAADLSEKAHYIAADNASGKAILATTGTTVNLGVIVDGGRASGDPVTIQYSGEARVKSSGTIGEGDAITATTAGEAVATTTDKDIVIGHALEAAADGDIFRILLHKSYMSHA